MEDKGLVLFIEPPVRDRRHIPERFAGCSYMLYPLPDLANFYMLSYFEKNGFRTELINAVLDQMTEQQFLEAIREFKPSFLVLHSVVLAKPIDLVYIPKILKAVDASLLIHGPEPTRVPREYLDAAGEQAHRVFIFRGEAEKNMLAFLSRGEKLGLSTVENGEIRHYPHGNDFIRMEELPFDFHKHPTVKRLSRHFLNAKFPKQPVATMLASRGCPFPCSYCVPNSVSFPGRWSFGRIIMVSSQKRSMPMRNGWSLNSERSKKQDIPL